MTTEFNYEAAWLEKLKDRLIPAAHAAGCPAARVESEVVQGPEEELDVDTGRLHAGRRVTRKQTLPGPYYTHVRCIDCGREITEPLDDADEVAKRRVAVGR